MRLADRLRRLVAGLRRLPSLPPPDRRLFLRAWRTLLIARLQVRRRRIDWMEVLVEKPLEPDSPIDPLVAIFEAARETCPVGTTCLPRALALRRFLEESGVGARLRLGVRKIGQEWSGHAWVECQGRLVGDSPALVREFVSYHETS